VVDKLLELTVAADIVLGVKENAKKR